MEITEQLLFLGVFNTKQKNRAKPAVNLDSGRKPFDVDNRDFENDLGDQSDPNTRLSYYIKWVISMAECA